MDRRKGANVPDLKRSLSSLSSQITSWSASRSCSPRKKSKRSPNVGLQDLEKHNLTTELAISEYDPVPWHEKYSPRNVTEVSVHKKKVKEVQDELIAMLEGRSGTRVLLLTGPSGCGKSTLVNLIAKDLLPKYRASSGRRHENVIRFENDMAPNGVSHMANFGEFLSEAKYMVGTNLSLVLVEDIPNVSHAESRKAFQRQLLEWLYLPKCSLPPLVICLTECELENGSGSPTAYGVDYSWTAETILSREILSHSCLRRVKFNPVNATLMKKTLMSVCVSNKATLTLMNKWSRRDKIVDDLTRSTGDLRSAIAMLQFWATSARHTSLALRESSPSYFHSIGRILHGSHGTEDDNKMINELLSSSKGHLSHENFLLGILENYSSFNKGGYNILDACKLADSLSESDSMGSVSESLEYCLRKVRHTLSGMGNVHHSHGRPKFPREWKIRQSQSEFRIQCEDYSNVSFYKYGEPRLFRNVALHFAFFDPKVKRIRFYKQKALIHYKAKIYANTALDIPKLRADELEVDPLIDNITRIGGEIGVMESEDTQIYEDDDNLLAKQSLDQMNCARDAKLHKLLEIRRSSEKTTEETDDEQFEEDPIVDSDEGAQANLSNILDDDDSILEVLSQKRPNLRPDPLVDESLSDSDLEYL